MKMKNNDYYSNVIYNCVKAITIGIFGIDFLLLAILLS